MVYQYISQSLLLNCEVHHTHWLAMCMVALAKILNLKFAVVRVVIVLAYSFKRNFLPCMKRFMLNFSETTQVLPKHFINLCSHCSVPFFLIVLNRYSVWIQQNYKSSSFQSCKSQNLNIKKKNKIRVCSHCLRISGEKVEPFLP